MRKSILFVSILLAHANAQAFPMREAINSRVIKKTSIDQKNGNINCSNFSGHWVGKCTDKQTGMESDDVINIVQSGCYSYKQDDEVIEIGKAKTETSSFLRNGQYGTTESHPFWTDSTLADWNDGRDTLIFSGSISAFSGSDGKSSIVSTIAGKRTIHDNQLIDEMTALDFKMYCVYHRD